MNKNYKNREWLYTEYKVKERTICDIAKECQVCYSGIYHYLKKFEIESNYKLNRWKKEEVKYLIENYGKLPVAIMAAKLNRVVVSVTSKAFELGITNIKSQQFDKKWSRVETEWLLYNYPIMGIKELVKNLNRSEKSIYRKASRLRDRVRLCLKKI